MGWGALQGRGDAEVQAAAACGGVSDSLPGAAVTAGAGTLA